VNRWKDWWDQADRDLAHAHHALEDQDYEWASFAGQQAAEKALKAVVMAAGGEPWGHLTTGLAEALPQSAAVSESVLDAARRLDKHYIPARYPNGFAAGYPGKLYTRGEAEQAIADATTVIEFCRGHLPGHPPTRGDAPPGGGESPN
jgi:HEPN domain-containing protein